MGGSCHCVRNSIKRQRSFRSVGRLMQETLVNWHTSVTHGTKTMHRPINIRYKVNVAPVNRHGGGPGA